MVGHLAASHSVLGNAGTRWLVVVVGLGFGRWVALALGLLGPGISVSYYHSWYLDRRLRNSTERHTQPIFLGVVEVSPAFLLPTSVLVVLAV